MLKVVETKIIGRSSRKNKANTDKILTYIQNNIEILVGSLNEKYVMADPGINGKSIQKQGNRRSWLDTTSLRIETCTWKQKFQFHKIW